MLARFRQPIVYGLVGGTLTAGYLVVAYAVSTALRLSAELSSIVGYLAMLPLGYLGHRTLTFQSTGAHVVELPRFVIATAIGLSLSLAIPFIARHALHQPALFGFVAVCIIVPLSNFLMMRGWVYLARRH